MSNILFSQRVITPGGIGPKYITIEAGKVSAVSAQRPDTATEILDYGEKVIMPGLVDPHVHVNEPGRTEWEGFATATQAAAAGGVTTLIDMPLNSDPVTTSLNAFQTKLAATENKLWIDCGFWGGVIPENTDELQAMIDAGIMGFKAFLIHSGIDDFPQSTLENLNQAMPILAKNKLPLLAHAELEGPAPEHLPEASQSYQAFLDSRPQAWEDNAIQMMIGLCRKYQCATHIVHLSSATALPLIESAKAEGLPFTVETCPHYLFFDSESIPDGETAYKCMPPIRNALNQEGLWEGLKAGLIDTIVTDHSPCTPGLKLIEEGDLLKAWGGIASLQFGLAGVWTRARDKGFDLTDLARLMCAKTAEMAGLGKIKGKIEVGFDADFVIWDPEKCFTLSPEMIYFKHPVSPYLYQGLYGAVHETYLRGQKIFSSKGMIEKPQGKILLRSI